MIITYILSETVLLQLIPYIIHVGPFTNCMRHISTYCFCQVLAMPNGFLSNLFKYRSAPIYLFSQPLHFVQWQGWKVGHKLTLRCYENHPASSTTHILLLIWMSHGGPMSIFSASATWGLSSPTVVHRVFLRSQHYAVPPSINGPVGESMLNKLRIILVTPGTFLIRHHSH